MDIKNKDVVKQIFEEKGQTLKFKIGQSLSDDKYLSGSIYLIKKGTARIISNENNKLKTYSKLGEGDFVGAISLLKNRP